MTTAMTKRQQGNGNPAVTFGNVVDNIFQNSLRRIFDDNFWEPDLFHRATTVPVNTRETEHAYELDVIAPGCRKEDFTINVKDNVLTISFMHDQQKEDSNEGRENQGEKSRWGWNEYLLNSFSRSFTLDDTVDITKINATYKDGILRLVIPKNEKAKKVSLDIEVK